jgi:hypothetical protein
LQTVNYPDGHRVEIIEHG